MAIQLPVNFPLPGESAIASYSYSEIQEGTGIVIYYGSTTYQGGALAYVLSNSVMPSNNYLTTDTLNSGETDVKKFDLDFDVVFNAPKNIKGVVYVAATLGITAANAGSRSLYYIAKVRKYSGTTESEIANATSNYGTWNGVTGAQTFVVKIPITSVEHFKKDDILRVTMEVYGSSAGGTCTMALWHDPEMRTDPAGDATVTSQLKIYMPFRLID